MIDDYKTLGQRIRGLREQHDMNQQDLADTIGISRPAVSQIENGERRVCADELVMLSKAFHTSVETILGLLDEPLIKLETNKGDKTKVKHRIRISVPQKNIEKFKEVLLHILSRVGSRPNIGETVIYKILYFIDFDFYEKYEEQLIGATYQKNRYGPTPMEFRKITDKMIREGDIEKLTSKYFAYPQTKYLPLRQPDLSKLKANELEMIDDVLNRLGDMNATQISEYSHNDVPWLTTENGDVMNYESVFYRTSPYSVRDYSDDVS